MILLCDCRSDTNEDQIHGFVNYCSNSFLEPNVKKTNDYRISKNPPSVVTINGSMDKRVSMYKYRGWSSTIDFPGMNM